VPAIRAPSFIVSIEESHLRLLAFVLVSVALLAAPASAQVRPFGIEANAYGGIWEGDEAVETGPTFGARLQFHVNQVFGLEATYGLVPTTLNTDGVPSVSSDELLGQFGMNAVLNLSAGAWTPYVTAGAGFVALEDVDFSQNIGLGGKYYFTEMIAGRVDVRGWFSKDAPSRGQFAHFEATVGASIQLGGDDDVDNDGVKNRDDKCPSTPEDKDGYKDDDGCADTDNDGDGILDVDDKCPMKAEDQDGDADTDGCPDLDDDGDGVLNEADKCPAKAEDKDGFEDEDGCPDEDNDADGINDAADKCPLKPETKNGFQDDDGCPEGDMDGDGIFDDADACKDKPENLNGIKDADGCPDEVPADLQAVLGIQTKVRFRKGKGESDGDGVSALAPVAEVLARYADIVFVVGATAHKVDDADALSAKRAEWVKAQLVKAGVKATQLEISGMGAKDLPAEPPKGARNDRVELSIKAPAAK